MTTLYHLEEWQEATGKWSCEHTSTHPKGIIKWRLPAELLDMSVPDFLEWLVKNYNPKIMMSKDGSFVCWSWTNQKDMRRYKNYINKISREKQFMI